MSDGITIFFKMAFFDSLGYSLNPGDDEADLEKIDAFEKVEENKCLRCIPLNRGMQILAVFMAFDAIFTTFKAQIFCNSDFDSNIAIMLTLF